MELLKRSISLLLVWTLFTQSFVAYAIENQIVDQNGKPLQTQPITPSYNLPGAEEVEQPVNPPGTPTGVQCKGGGEKLEKDGVCCVGYENINGYCNEIQFEDKSLVQCEMKDPSCPPDTTCPPKKISCGGGMGCLPQTTASLFARLAPTTDPVDEISDNRTSFEAQVNTVENPQENGGSCNHNMDCKSYNCVALKCEEKKVCRMAAEGEVATAGVNCGPDLVRNMNGVCELSNDAKNTVYLGLLDEATITPVRNCQFELSKETKEKSIVAMKSLRAMEYFLQTINVPVEQECFFVMPKLKYEVGTSLYESRKAILGMFTDTLNGIETDYAQILASGEKYRQSLESNGGKNTGSNIVTVHNQTISEADLGSRVLSGYDAMMIMWRRNLLFQSYETAMLEVMKHIQKPLTGLNTNMSNWNDGDTSFNIGDRVVSGPCQASKYKRKKWWKWRTYYYESVKDRWAWQYDITGNAPLNADIVKREKVSNILGLLSGHAVLPGAEEDGLADAAVKKAISDFTSGRWYMMDPVVFGGINHGQFGQNKTIGSKGGFLGFSGFKDLRNGRYIRGDSAGSFTGMHNVNRENIKSFYQTLKEKKDQKKFIYEPELVTTSAKDCLDKERTGKCTEFDQFLEDVNDESFAYFLAYSRNTTDSNAGLFRNATTYKRKLLAKMEVDIQNIAEYYKTIIKHRDEQNACIEKVINGLIDNDILVDGSGGVQEGASNSVGSVTVRPSKLKGNPAVTETNSRKINVARLSPLSRNKFMFNLNDARLKSLSGNTMLDSVSGLGTTSVDGANVNAADATLAIRKEAMKKANELAAKNGVNVTGKNKVNGKLTSVIAKSAGAGSSAASGGSSSSLSNAKSAFGHGNFGDSAVSKSAVDGSSGPKGEGVDGKGEMNVGDKKGGGAGDENVAGTDPLVKDPGAGDGANAAGAYGANGAGADGANGALGANGGRDGTGLSEEEKENLLSDAERNKSDYKGHEEDGIFKKVSKAYVRNLEKVLIKKKKID